MSTNLYWEPAERKKRDAGDTDLKFALRKKYDSPVNTFLSSKDVSYLEGLTDAGVNAKNLIEAIEKHEVIHVTEE